MKSKISRRSFLRNIAAAGSGAAALGLLAGCSSSSTAASSGSTAAAEDKYTPGTYSASKTISYSEIGVSMTFDANSITACEITSSGEQDLLTDDKKTAMAKAIVEGQSADVDAVTSCTLVASVGAIQECVADCIAQATGTEVEKPETTEVTGRVPGYCGPGDWLGEAPADPDKYEDAGTYDVVIVGGGHAGVGAAFGAVDEGATVAVIEKQPWGNFVDLDGTGTNMGGWYGEDIGHVNSKLLIERGYGPYDTGAITSEFCKRAAGRVNPEIIKNFVQYSGQMFDRYEEIYDSYEEERKANDSDVYLADTAVIVPKATGDGKTGDQWVDGEPAGLACYVTDANWAKTLKAAPLDHGAPNFGMQDYWDKIEQDMNNTVSGQANTITIANLAERTQMAGTIYRADTLDELADLLGYKGAAKQNFLDSIAHYNELCYAGVDSDYGKDAPYMVPIDTAPFFGGTSSTGHSSNPMMVTMSGVITDETQNVLNKDWEPIEGLYVAGNCLGGRYGFGYSTPFAGNSVGMAMTHGWTAGHQVASDKKFLGEPVEAMEAPAGGPGGPGGHH